MLYDIIRVSQVLINQGTLMSGYISIAGIGYADDLQYIYTKANSVENIDFQTAGILNTSGINISSVISRNINEWNPVIKPGYCYISGKEYYAYADKCLHVFSIKDIINNENYIDNDDGWDINSDDLLNDETLVSYCSSGTYVPSGYFGIKIDNIIETAPIAVNILPTSITPDYIDKDMSGYVYFGTLDNNTSGFKYITSSYLTSDDLSQIVTGSLIDNSVVIPRFAKYTPLAYTGFVEEYETAIGTGFRPVIGTPSGIKTLPCLSIYSEDFDSEQSIYAQYLRDSKLLIVPGSITNIAVSYESNDSDEIILKDINVNPLNATDENQLIGIMEYQTSGIKTITPTLSDAVIASENASYSNLHYSILDVNGTGCSGFRMNLSIDKKYYAYDINLGYVPINIEYEAMLMNNMEFYKLQLPTEYLNQDNVIIIDENQDVQLITNINNTAGIYYTNSYGSLIGCGGEIVNTSGYLYTDQNGSVTARYLANAMHEYPRRSYIATLKATHPVCEDVYTKLYVQNTEQDDYYVSATESLLPDIRTAIDIAIYTGSGYTVQNWPLGGPTAVSFYQANEWFHSYAFSSGIPTVIGNGQTINEHKHITVDFIEPEDVVAVYKFINAEILKSDDYTVLE